MSGSAELVTYSVTAAEIAAKKAEFAGLSCDTPKGYEQTRLAIASVRDARVAVEKRRVELKADALAYGRLVDSRAKELTSLLMEIEEPLKAKKEAVDAEKARIKAEAEAAKLRALEAEIAARRAAQEEEARIIREAEEKRLAEERAALEAERAKLAEIKAAMEAERKAEEDRLAAVRRAEEERLAAERRAEEDRQRAEREAIEAERKAVAAEREKAERAEFERLAVERAKREAAEEAERDRATKAAREAERLRLMPDLDKLTAYAATIRALPEPDLIDLVLDDKMRTATDRLGEAADYLDEVVAGWRAVAS